MFKHLPFYEIKGNHRQVGEFVGETFKEYIQATIAKRKKEIANYESYLPTSQMCLEVTREYFPNLIIETESIARAANVPLADYFFMNNRDFYDETEISDLKFSSSPDHCTGVAGFNHGQLVVGHNEDWSINIQDEVHILKATIGEVTFIGLNYAIEIVGSCASMNNFGLVQCINDVHQTNRIGVPKNYVARAVLEAKSLDEAEAIIRNVSRASGYNHLLARDKEIRNIEVTSDKISVQKVSNHSYVHTNHYLAEELKQLEKFHTKSSEERYNRANALIKDNLTVEDIKSILSDTANPQNPICRVDETVASAIFVPSELKALFCYGPPCLGEYEEFLI